MDLLQSSLRNLQSVARLSLETADLLIDFRQDVEQSILNQVQQSVGGTEPAAQLVTKGIELTTMAFNRQHALERDLLARLQQFMAGVQEPSRSAKTHEPAAPANEPQVATGEPVHVTARVGSGPVIVPLKLRNHHDTPQTVILSAAKYEGMEGVALPTSQIHFHPEKFTLPAQAVTIAYVIIEIDAEFRSPVEYWTEVRVGGSDPRRFPLCLTILPPNPPESGTSPDTPTVSTHGEHP